MKKINNIISSELIVRTNNVNYKQEFGKVGDASNIINEGVSTIFTTALSIKNIVFVTVNGVTLIPGKHFEQTSSTTISISNSGAAIKAVPGITTEISVGYHFINRRAGVTKVNVPPKILFFQLDKYEGRNESITFDFEIQENNGKNIFWSILKDGSEEPLFSGNSLSTSGGTSISTTGTELDLTTHISEIEYLARYGETIPFTFVVIYDVSDDLINLNEKLLASADYKLLDPLNVTGDIVISPELIDTADPADTILTYNINNPLSSVVPFSWSITKTVGTEAPTIIVSGTHTSALNGEYRETMEYSAGTIQTIRYVLSVTDDAGATAILGNDSLRVLIPSDEQSAFAGYLSADIMNYPNPSDPNQYITIGSTGTSQDVVEYNTRVPRAVFTKEITISSLVDQDFIDAPVNTFGGTVKQVYFIIEIPDAWGSIRFNQTLGEIDPTMFNKVYLQNGYTAYIYKYAPSSAYRPADYFLKPD